MEAREKNADSEETITEQEALLKIILRKS